MKNNKGFSYVEMIIVLAILALMVGFITISIGTNVRNEVSRTSEKLESLVNKARTMALTKGSKQGQLQIALVDGTVYAYVGEMSNSNNKYEVKNKGEKLCSGTINITMNGSISDGKVHRVKFKQSTGAVISDSESSIEIVPIMVERDFISSTINIDAVTGKVTRGGAASNEEDSEE